MSDMISRTVVFPVSGAEFDVELEREDRATREFDVSNALYGMTVEFKSQSGSEWLEVSWTMEREDGDEPVVEEDGVLELCCPACGSIEEFSFEGEEFENLGACSSCDGVEFIRDEPTEQIQSDIINYTCIFSEVDG